VPLKFLFPPSPLHCSLSVNSPVFSVDETHDCCLSACSDFLPSLCNLFNKRSMGSQCPFLHAFGDVFSLPVHDFIASFLFFFDFDYGCLVVEGVVFSRFPFFHVIFFRGRVAICFWFFPIYVLTRLGRGGSSFGFRFFSCCLQGFEDALLPPC